MCAILRIIPEDLLRVAESVAPDLTVVGPEAPLVAGVVDAFRAAGRLIVGPTRRAAQLEGSKIFAKEFMQRAGIPTARFRHAPKPSRHALKAARPIRIARWLSRQTAWPPEKA